MQDLAERLAELNASGLPVVGRFGHEMNPWGAAGGLPPEVGTVVDRRPASDPGAREAFLVDLPEGWLSPARQGCAASGRETRAIAH